MQKKKTMTISKKGKPMSEKVTTAIECYKALNRCTSVSKAEHIRADINLQVSQMDKFEKAAFYDYMDLDNQ